MPYPPDLQRAERETRNGSRDGVKYRLVPRAPGLVYADPYRAANLDDELMPVADQSVPPNKTIVVPNDGPQNADTRYTLPRLRSAPEMQVPPPPPANTHRGEGLPSKAEPRQSNSTKEDSTKSPNGKAPNPKQPRAQMSSKKTTPPPPKATTPATNAKSGAQQPKGNAELKQLEQKLTQLEKKRDDLEAAKDLMPASDLRYYAIPDLQERIRTLKAKGEAENGAAAKRHAPAPSVESEDETDDEILEDEAAAGSDAASMDLYD